MTWEKDGEVAGLYLYNYEDVTEVFNLRNSMIVFALQEEKPRVNWGEDESGVWNK